MEDEPGRFSIRTEDNKAKIYRDKTLDRDYPLGHDIWQINVEAKYENSQSFDKSSYALVNIKLKDINDNKPIFNCCVTGSVAEDVSSGRHTNFIIITVSSSTDWIVTSDFLSPHFLISRER